MPKIYHFFILMGHLDAKVVGVLRQNVWNNWDGIKIKFYRSK